MFNRSIPVWLSLHLEIMVKLYLVNCLWAKMRGIDGSLTHDWISTDTTSADYEWLDEEYFLKWHFLIFIPNHAFFLVRYSGCNMLNKEDNITD